MLGGLREFIATYNEVGPRKNTDIEVEITFFAC